MWLHRTIQLPPATRGFHLITELVEKAVPEISQVQIGLLNVFIQHTSASLTINENADPDVPRDLEAALNIVASEDFPYEHTVEGPDDMPAHVKSVLIGASVTVPIHAGKLCLGTWQGIYLCEHRNRASGRKLVLTVQGEVLGVHHQ
jgi:secondary thiamine-phosphate synthase enzyme